MESDSESNYEEEMNEQSEDEQSVGEASVDHSAEPLTEEDQQKLISMWDKIQRATLSKNKEFWSKIWNEDKHLFRIRFKEYFIDVCKDWLQSFNDFIENDDIWQSLMETKTKVLDDVSDQDDEALLSAIDMRKYKLLKVIDWGQLEQELEEESESDSESDNGL